MSHVHEGQTVSCGTEKQARSGTLTAALGGHFRLSELVNSQTAISTAKKSFAASDGTKLRQRRLNLRAFRVGVLCAEVK